MEFAGYKNYGQIGKEDQNKTLSGSGFGDPGGNDRIPGLSDYGFVTERIFGLYDLDRSADHIYLGFD